MEITLQKAIKRYCGGNATCERYAEGVIENITPKIKVGVKYTCKRKY